MKLYCLPFRLKANCFWWTLLIGMEKKAFPRSIVAYQVPGDVLIYSNNETTSGTAATIGSHCLIKLTIIHHPSPRSICLLHRPDRQIERECGGNHHLASFKSWMMALILAVPPGKLYCFGFEIFLGRNSSCGFHLAFATIIALSP